MEIIQNIHAEILRGCVKLTLPFTALGELVLPLTRYCSMRAAFTTHGRDASLSPTPERDGPTPHCGYGKAQTNVMGIQELPPSLT